MWELLLESWRLGQSEGSCCHAWWPQRRLVTNFLVWTECFKLNQYPEKTPHFMVYLCTITRASRNFERAAWVSYDMAYWRQDANQRSLDWGVVDPALYNEAFMG